MFPEARVRSSASVASLLGDVAFPNGIDSGAVAVRWGAHRRSYSELRDRSRGLAAGLAALDVEPGACVGVHCRNRGETFEIYFACANGGWTLLPTNFRYRARDLAEVYAVAQPAVVFVDADLEAVVWDALSLAGCSGVRVVALAAEDSGADYEGLATAVGPTPDVPPSDHHMVLFSSGTTGRAKGVAFGHEHILNFAYQQIVAFPALRTGMVTVVVPPMFNAAGINDLAMATLMAGGTLAIHPSGGWSPRRLAEHVSEVGGTHAILFPTMLNQLLDQHAKEPIDLSTLRVAVIGGEHCPPVVLRRMAEEWPELRLIYTYGLTEGGLITLADAFDLSDRPGSVGRVAQGQRLAILDDDGRPLSPGSAGEVAAASTCASAGYWRDTGDPGTFVDGWVRTGDIGVVDDDGHLHIVGRKKDMIISKGQNIFPAEIEAVIAGHRDVAACSVVGVPDPTYGELVCAVIVRRKGSDVDGDEISRYVSGEIAPYKQPRRIEFVDALPISDNNKVLKRLLREQLADTGRA